MSEIKYVWKSIRVKETDYDGCYNCIHAHDSEDVCRVRGCVHAIGQIKDYYKRATETHDNTRETHGCVCERTETHVDLISRKAAIDFIDAGHLCNPNELRWSDNDVVNFLKKRPSAEPERAQFGPDCHLVWQYCTDPNDVMKAVMEKDENWEGLYSPEQIISIVYDSNHKSYVVFWTAKW